MLKAVEAGVDPGVTGVLVDEQFGAPRNIPGEAKERGLMLAMPVEKSGQNEFDFQYGDEFGAHIETFDPDFSKVLVRYNPDGDAGDERAPDRAPQAPRPTGSTSTTASSSSSCSCRPRTHQLEQVGGDTDRYDAELRPELMRQHDRRVPGRRRRGRRLEDRGHRQAGGLRAASPRPRGATAATA